MQSTTQPKKIVLKFKTLGVFLVCSTLDVNMCACESFKKHLTIIHCHEIFKLKQNSYNYKYINDNATHEKVHL